MTCIRKRGMKVATNGLGSVVYCWRSLQAESSRWCIIGVAVSKLGWWFIVGGHSKLSKVNGVLLKVAPKLRQGVLWRLELEKELTNSKNVKPRILQGDKDHLSRKCGLSCLRRWTFECLSNIYKFRRHSSPMPSRVPIQGRQRPWSGRVVIYCSHVLLSDI